MREEGDTGRGETVRWMAMVVRHGVCLQAKLIPWRRCLQAV